MKNNWFSIKNIFRFWSWCLMFRTLLITVTVDKQMEIFLDEKNLIILRNKQPEIVMQQRKKIWIYQIQGRILSENSQIKWNGSLALPRPSYKQATVKSFWKKMGPVKQWSTKAVKQCQWAVAWAGLGSHRRLWAVGVRAWLGSGEDSLFWK